MGKSVGEHGLRELLMSTLWVKIQMEGKHRTMRLNLPGKSDVEVV